MRDCRVQRDRKSRKQPITLLLTLESHMTYPQVPGSDRKSRKKRHTVIANKKNHLFDLIQSRKVAIYNVGRMQGLSDVTPF